MELDPITADFPSRTAREEDEEAAERATGGGLAPEPVAIVRSKWTPEARAVSATTGGRLKTPLMIVATTPESCALLRSAAAASAAENPANVSLLGALVLPGLSLSGNTLFSLAPGASSSPPSDAPPAPPAPLPAPTDRVCAVLSIGTGEETPGEKTVVLVLCQYGDSVPEERAFGLAAALCAGVDAGETLVLSSLPSHLIPGSAGAEEGEPPLYRLQTSAALSWARRAQEKVSSSSSSPASSSSPKLAALPAGAAAPGFPAAVVSRAAAMRKPAVLLIRADACAGAPPAAALAALASGAAAAVSVSCAASVTKAFASVLGKASAATAAAAAAAAKADAASARAAVYA